VVCVGYADDRKNGSSMILERRANMATLVIITILPLGVITCQLAFGAAGPVGYSIYKVAFLVPPLLYCRWHGISVFRDILQFGNWRSGLKLSIGLSIAAAAIFAGAYAAWSDFLIDEATIVDKIDQQFGVDRTTVLLVAPFTILLNSLLEESFYRGFSFGLLVRKNLAVGYLLPAVAFTVQHVLFIYHWVSVLPLVLAIVGLFVLALLLEAMYGRFDTIVAPWIVHAGGDVAMMGIALTMFY
jgi:membrane protease YdiL (CAAX protease family)